VMRDHSVGEIRIEERERVQHLGAAVWMRRDEAPLIGRHVAGVIVDDVEERFVDFSDVVEEGHALDASDGRFVESRGARQRHAVRRHASHVGSGDRVVRVDGIQERLERRGGEARGTAGFAALSKEERADASTKREENGISHGAERGKKETLIRRGSGVRRQGSGMERRGSKAAALIR